MRIIREYYRAMSPCMWRQKPWNSRLFYKWGIFKNIFVSTESSKIIATNTVLVLLTVFILFFLILFIFAIFFLIIYKMTAGYHGITTSKTGRATLRDTLPVIAAHASIKLCLLTCSNLSPVSTTRVHGHSSRAELTARELGCMF